MHCHAGKFHLAFQVGHDAAEFGSPRQKLRQPRLAAELGRRLVQDDLVAAFGKNRGSLHAGGPAAGNDDPLSSWRPWVSRRGSSSRPVSGCWMQEIG